MDSPGIIQFGRAFHSIYFEVLGEQGYPGLIMFLLLAGSTMVKLRRLSKKVRAYPELEWVRSLSDALQGGLAVFLTAGAFVGIAFQPMFWYFIAIGISLNVYVWRFERPQVKKARILQALNSPPDPVVPAPAARTAKPPAKPWIPAR